MIDFSLFIGNAGCEIAAVPNVPKFPKADWEHAEQAETLYKQLFSDSVPSVPTVPNEIGATSKKAGTAKITPEPSSTAASAMPEPVSYGSLPTVPDTDDRRTCSQCRNLASRVCSVAKPGGIVSANRGYRPDLERLRRCTGYLPDGSDSDPRPGAERWPGLT